MKKSPSSKESAKDSRKSWAVIPSQDVARILRTSCRVNSKYPHKPEPKIIYSNDARYTIEDLNRYWIPLENGKAKIDLGDIGELPERFQALLAKNRRVERNLGRKAPRP